MLSGDDTIAVQFMAQYLGALGCSVVYLLSLFVISRSKIIMNSSIVVPIISNYTNFVNGTPENN